MRIDVSIKLSTRFNVGDRVTINNHLSEVFTISDIYIGYKRDYIIYELIPDVAVSRLRYEPEMVLNLVGKNDNCNY